MFTHNFISHFSHSRKKNHRRNCRMLRLWSVYVDFVMLTKWKKVPLLREIRYDCCKAKNRTNARNQHITADKTLSIEIHSPVRSRSIAHISKKPILFLEINSCLLFLTVCGFNDKKTPSTHDSLFFLFFKYFIAHWFSLKFGYYYCTRKYMHYSSAARSKTSIIQMIVIVLQFFSFSTLYMPISCFVFWVMSEFVN